MKTKEFIKKVKEMGYHAKNMGFNLAVWGINNREVFAHISTGRSHILYLNTSDFYLIRLCLEYAETPIEEREDEKLYTVQLPDALKRGKRIFALGKLKEHESEIIIQKVKKETLNCDRCKLTESEIKRNHEYLWQFAKEVE